MSESSSEPTCGQLWRINLDNPPQITQIGLGVHGLTPIERYQLPNLWCMHLYRYRAKLVLNGIDHQIEPGSVSVVPPDTKMEYRFEGRSVHVYCHFKFEPIVEGDEVRFIEATQNVGSKFGDFSDRMQSSIANGLNHNSRRSDAALWSILWELTEASYERLNAQPEDRQHHPAVRHAAKIIEVQMAQPLTVVQIAKACNVSHSYLDKLFRKDLSSTVVGYIRMRRMRRAYDLLTQSTLPIRVIAATVGVPDLHLFNKTMRRELGQAPRVLRSFANEDRRIND